MGDFKTINTSIEGGVEASGHYDFGAATAFTLPVITEESGLPTASQMNRIYFHQYSGLLVIENSGAGWNTLTLTPPLFWGFSGLYPAQIGGSGFLQEWLEPSGISKYDTSGVITWERNAFGQLGNYFVKWTNTSGPGTASPFYDINNTLQGYDCVYFNGISGIPRNLKPAAAMNQGGDDNPFTFIYVMRWDGSSDNNTLISFANGAADNVYTWVGFRMATAGYPDGTIQVQKRAAAANIIVNAEGALVGRTGVPIILSVVHSGVWTDIFVNGNRVMSSGQDAASQSLSVGGMGILNRSNDAGPASGLWVWEAMHWTSGLSYSDRVELENYLSSKYHISLAR